MSSRRSRWRGWRTAAREAVCRFAPAPGVDQERPPASPATARIWSRQPPIRLPFQESDIRRLVNPLFYPALHFAYPVLQRGLTSALPAALNSLAVRLAVKGKGIGVFFSFFTELRAAKIPVSLREYLTLMEAMQRR